MNPIKWIATQKNLDGRRHNQQVLQLAPSWRGRGGRPAGLPVRPGTAAACRRAVSPSRAASAVATRTARARRAARGVYLRACMQAPAARVRVVPRQGTRGRAGVLLYSLESRYSFIVHTRILQSRITYSCKLGNLVHHVHVRYLGTWGTDRNSPLVRTAQLNHNLS